VANLFLVKYPEEPIQVPDKGEVSIGRADNNDVVLTEPRVSRKHAVINWLEPPGVFVISDLESSNGTYLNGTKLPPNHPGLLKDWDKIRIASSVFTIRVVDDPKVIASEFEELRERVQCEVTEVLKVADLTLPQVQPGFSGDLAHLCPVELFQMLETGYKTGILTLKTDEGEGTYTIISGQVVKAEFGKKHAEEAVYEVLKFNDGMFAFDPQEVSVKKPEITASITSLLMEGCRILDEASLNDQRLDDVINP
jgi:pSer/pThr/pTyr-binding forkhead associated (FHA) protein